LTIATRLVDGLRGLVLPVDGNSVSPDRSFFCACMARALPESGYLPAERAKSLNVKSVLQQL